MTENRLSDYVGHVQTLQQMCAEPRIHSTGKRTHRGVLLLNIPNKGATCLVQL